MKNAMAVLCSALLPMNALLLPVRALADSKTKTSETEWLKVTVAGDAKEYFCDASECGDKRSVSLIKDGVPLYSDKGETRSQYNLHLNRKGALEAVPIQTSESASVGHSDGQETPVTFRGEGGGELTRYLFGGKGMILHKDKEGKEPAGLKLVPHPVFNGKDGKPKHYLVEPIDKPKPFAVTIARSESPASKQDRIVGTQPGKEGQADTAAKQKVDPSKPDAPKADAPKADAAKVDDSDPLYAAISEKIKDPLERRMIQYLITHKSDKLAEQKQMLDKELPKLRADAARLIISVAANPNGPEGKQIFASALFKKSLDGTKNGAKIDEDSFLASACARQYPGGGQDEKETTALTQLEKSDKLGKVADGAGGATVVAQPTSGLQAKCAKRKADLALKDQKASGQGTGPLTSPPAPGSKKADGKAKEDDKANGSNPGLMTSLKSYGLGAVGGAAAGLLAAAIAGGPLGMAALAGCAVGLAGMAIYNNWDEIKAGLGKIGGMFGGMTGGGNEDPDRRTTPQSS